MIDCVDDLPTARALCNWFGHVLSFHDGYLTNLSIDQSGRGRMRVRAFRMTSEVNERGHNVLDKHCEVFFDLEEIQIVDLNGFTRDACILDRLVLRKIDEGFRVDIEPNYGIWGFIVAKKMTLTFEPVEHDGDWLSRN